MDQYQYLSNCTLTPPLPSQLITSKGYCWVKEGVGTKLLSYWRSSIFFTFAIHLYKVSFIYQAMLHFLFSIILTTCLLILQLCLKKQKKLFFLDQIAFTTWWKISWRSGKRKSSYIIGSLWRRANARNVGFRTCLRWPNYIINSVHKTKLSCNTAHWRSTTVSIATYPLY